MADEQPVADVPAPAEDVQQAPAPEQVPEPAPEAPAPEPAEVETPAEEASEPAEEAPAPEKPKKAKKAKVEAPVEEPQPEVPADPTPEEEVEKTGQLDAAGPNVVDGSGILTQTNEDVIRNFPKNDQGQVVIGPDGQIVGLEASQQPTQPSGKPG